MGVPDKADSPFVQQLVLRSADLLSLQSLILEAVARGTPLADTLELLCLKLEELAPELRCSVLLLDGDRLRHGAAPSLPSAYTRAIDGIRIGPMVGSCGTAAYLGQPVQVDDIATDPRWQDYREYALAHGLAACWSSPVIGRDKRVLGTFALYYGEARTASEFHRDLVKAATHLSAIAIERHNMDAVEHARLAELEASQAQMAQINRLLEQRVSERTADLDQRNAELIHTIEELQRTQSALIEARKLISLGRLVAGVAHELNTPIGNARLLSSSLHERCAVLRQRIAHGQLRRHELDQFINAVEDGGVLLDQALQHAAERISSFRAIVVEHDDARRVSFSLDEPVAGALMLLTTALREASCELSMDVSPQLQLTSYPAQLQQIITNVLDNAISHGLAGRAGGHIRIQGRKLPDNKVELLIQDDGRGIPAADLAQVFDPFFTTGLAQGYAGLGLHVAYTLAHGLLGGQLHVASEPGKGTAVTLILPAEAPAHALPTA